MKQNQQSRQEDELAQRKIERQQMERQQEEERKLRQQEPAGIPNQRLNPGASARSCWAAKVREDIKKRELQWQN